MPLVRVRQTFPHPPARVIDFFRRPANIVAVAPPEYHLRLAEAPDLIAVGSRVAVEARRWGVRQRIVTEVTRLDEETIVEEQREGPFRRWVHTRRFTADGAGGTVLEEEIDFEPPGGVLGLVLTAARIEADLRAALDGRHARVVELLATS